MASIVRAAALRSRCLSFAKTCSIGLRSGEYFGRKRSFGAGGAYQLPHGFAFMATEIVHNNDVAGAKRGDENLLDIVLKTYAVDRTIK